MTILHRRVVHTSRRLRAARCRAVLATFALGVLHAAGWAEPGDEICFPLFRKAGAIPLTTTCELDAQGADGGMGTYFCTAEPERAERYCGTPTKGLASCPRTPYPISIGTGDKTLTESDYGPADALLSLTRHYNSSPAAMPGRMLGAPWRSSFEARIDTPVSDTVAATRPDGRTIYFKLQDGSYAADGDVKDRLTRLVQAGQTSGWRYRLASGRLETYDAGGALMSIEAGDGYRVDLSYSTSSTPPATAPGPGYLIRATDSFGRGIDFQYDGGGHLRAASPAPGTTYQYTVTGEVLARVQAPDGAVRDYRYNEPAFVSSGGAPHYLTGVEDERDARVVNYFYDAKGLAYKEQRLASPGQVVDEYALAYNGRAAIGSSSGTTTVNGPGGAQRIYTFSKIRGLGRMTSASQPAGSGCMASTKALQYDSNGNATQVDDFNGNRACSAFDTARNVELKRVEGLAVTDSCNALLQATTLPAKARKISSAWHPLLERLTRLAEPRRLTTYVYNGQPDPFNANQPASCAPSRALMSDGTPIAVLCKKVEQATTDTNGVLGFSASVDTTTAARVQQWSYNDIGQVLTAKDPLNNTTTNTYYADTTADHTKGDLHTITNAKQQVTTYTKYNPAGQWLEMKDGNNVLTTRTFDLRERLKSVTVGGGTTSYDYWPTGLLKKVILPDNSSLSYGYDGAQRLTSITDQLGNSITYTLDNAGNRTAEAAKDPNGVLARSLSRIPDALNRIQQVTGRE